MEVKVPSDFESAVAALGVSLAPEQVDQLSAFVGLLVEASARFNLTTVREPEEVWSRHVLDSLSLVPKLPPEQGLRVVDVGSGAGVPGLVLAIARPDLQFTLVDATGKKVRHIGALAQELGLAGVQALQGRAEDLAGLQGEQREAYDVAVARALAPLPVLLELVVPFLRVPGLFLAIKGQRAQDELQVATRALAQLHTVLQDQVRTPTGTILCLRKTGATPRKYPRRAGEPKLKPL